MSVKSSTMLVMLDNEQHDKEIERQLYNENDKITNSTLGHISNAKSTNISYKYPEADFYLRCS